MSRYQFPGVRSGSGDRNPIFDRGLSPEYRAVARESGASVFVPPSGLDLWIDVPNNDPQYIIDQGGGLVTFTQLQDFSGNDQHATANYSQNDGPEVISGSINGLTTARFTDYPRRTFLQSTMNTNITVATVTMYGVFKQNQHRSNSSPVSLIDSTDSDDQATTGAALAIQGSTSEFVGTFRNSTYLASLSNGNPGDGLPYIFKNEFTGTSNTVFSRHQGNEYTSTPVADSNVFDAKMVQFGARSRGSLQYADVPYHGEVGEVLLWRRVLNSAEHTQVISYLSGKWGI